MRIVAGKARGRALKGPKGEGLRPTSDRARQTLFDVLGQWCEGMRVLDVFAGTGALALEAISRGATHAVLVDSGREALKLCRENAEGMGVLPQVEIVSSDAFQAIDRLKKKGDRFHLVFADPPYALEAGAKLAAAFGDGALLEPGARVCIEHDRREEDVPETAGVLTRVDQRKLGDTVISIFAAPAPTT
ncbi:MAG: 16S rRNA (guanine(966)-N(2))-methyltransferase RsmD [Myxococcaceae bacterium]